MEKNQSQNQVYINKRAYSAKAHGTAIKPAIGNPYGNDKQVLNSSKTFKIKFRPKAPQSNNFQNSSPNHSTKDFAAQEDSLRPQTSKPLTNGFNLQRRNQLLSRETDFFRNNITVFDKERLFEQLQTAKLSVNSLTEENFQVKTKNLQLELKKQLQKYEKIIEDFQNNGNMKSVQMKLGVETSLFLQIKKQVKDQANEIKEKNQLIEQFKRNMKVTRFQEMETEKQFLYDELQRLRKLIVICESEQKSQEQWINTHNQLVSNIELLKNELEKTQIDNQELGNIIIVYEDRVKNLQKQLTKSSQSNQRYLKENENLRSRVKRGKNQPVEGGYFISQEEVDRINDDNNMMKQRIQELETQIKKHQSDNRKQLEQKRPQTRQPEKEVDLMNMIPKVSQEDIQLIADEIKFSLISQGIPYQTAKDSILPKEFQRKVRINQDQIKQILQVFPFNINDEIKLDKALRFIVENDNGDQYVYPANPQRLINTGIVKNQLNSLLEEYFLFEELENFNQNVVQTSINELFQEYEGRLFEKWINDLKQANYITKIQLDKLFQDSQITLQEPYNQYYYLFLYGQSSHDFSHIPSLTALKPFQKIVIQQQNQQSIQKDPSDQDIYDEDFQEENHLNTESKQQLEMLEQIQEDENSQKPESINEAYFDDPEFEKELNDVQDKFQNQVLIIDDPDDNQELEEKKDIDQIDEQDFINYKDEYEDAALKIQKVFRGKKVRKEFQDKKTDQLTKQKKSGKKSKEESQINHTDKKSQQEASLVEPIEKSKSEHKIHEFNQSEEKNQEQTLPEEFPQQQFPQIENNIEQQEIKEQADAALKIQKVYRGKKVRKETQAKKKQKQVTQVQVQEAQKEINIVEEEVPETNMRQEAPELKEEIPQIQEHEPKLKEEIPQIQEPEVKEEIPQIQVDEPEVKEEIPQIQEDDGQAGAAVKIQSVFRGKKARQQTKQMKEEKISKKNPNQTESSGEHQYDQFLEQHEDKQQPHIDNQDIIQKEQQSQLNEIEVRNQEIQEDAIEKEKIEENYEQLNNDKPDVLQNQQEIYEQVEERQQVTDSIEMEYEKEAFQDDEGQQKQSEKHIEERKSEKSIKSVEKIKENNTLGKSVQDDIELQKSEEPQNEIITEQNQKVEITTEDKELEGAAVKIQSAFRGKKARKEVKQQQKPKNQKKNHGLKLNVHDTESEQKRSGDNQFLTPISLGNNKEEEIPHIDISGADEKF